MIQNDITNSPSNTSSSTSQNDTSSSSSSSPTLLNENSISSSATSTSPPVLLPFELPHELKNWKPTQSLASVIRDPTARRTTSTSDGFKAPSPPLGVFAPMISYNNFGKYLKKYGEAFQVFQDTTKEWNSSSSSSSGKNPR
jgi:hypothetical protein